MANRLTEITLPDGRKAQGTEVPIDLANERWSEFKLSDGTELRAKINMINIMRIDGEYDAAGQPLYFVNAAPSLVFVSIPDGLKRKGS